MPNVQPNVFQAINRATASNKDITAREVAGIRTEMEKQGGIDADEQAVLTAIETGNRVDVRSGNQSATLNPSEIAFPSAQNATAEGARVVSANTDHGVVYDDLRESDLASNLARSVKTRLNSAPVALAALRQANDNEVNLGLIQNLGDADLRRVAGNSDGKALLRYAYTELNANRTNSEEGKAMQRVAAAASSTHGHLAGFEFNVPPAVTAALTANSATLQNMSDGSQLSSPNYDNYETTVTLPNDAAARELFERFARQPNSVGDNYFDAMNDFSLRGGGGNTLPKVGDIYDIDIAGPDNGSVMVVGGKPITDQGGSVVVATITEAKYGEHPENGVREFGFRKNDDNSYTFYTRGASRGINSATQQGGSVPQEQSWRGLIDGFQEQATALGGTVVRPRSQTNTNTPF